MNCLGDKGVFVIRMQSIEQEKLYSKQTHIKNIAIWMVSQMNYNSVAMDNHTYMRQRDVEVSTV